MKNLIRTCLRIIGIQRWIRLGVRYRLILSRPYEAVDFEVPFFGYIYKGTLSEYIDKYVFYFGAYEREELALIKKYIQPDKTVLDIGANSGHHSLFFSTRAKEVHSFEPYDKVFNKMKQRIKENNIKNIFTYKFGIGLKDEIREFFPPLPTNEGGGSFVRENREGEKIILEVKNGDKAISQIKDIGFIKIDVEGMELSVLEGLKGIIEKNKPTIFAEMSPESQKNFIMPQGYSGFIVEANNPFLFLFNIPGCKLSPFFPQNRTENILLVYNK